jgi:hypothetical protein
MLVCKDYSATRSFRYDLIKGIQTRNLSFHAGVEVRRSHESYQIKVGGRVCTQESRLPFAPL